ncbi:hypothetical protein ACFL23_04735 [Patescibacteria group bacterium]
MSFFVGLTLITIGVILVIKSEWFYQNFGSIQWAEQHLGTSGGSRIMYKLIGLICIFLGIMGITGLLNVFLLWITSPLTKFGK